MEKRERVAMGRYIKQVRTGKGIIREELALRLDMSGPEVSLIESGDLEVRKEEVLPIADGLGIHPGCLLVFYGETPVVPPEAEELLKREPPAGASLERTL